MGDKSRFRLMADLISEKMPSSLRLADVAGGNGNLQTELLERGFTNVVSWDKRANSKGPRRNHRFALFDYRSAPRDYDCVVGMHPDAATDHIVSYAVKHRKPFLVCPCCVLPSATRLQAIGYTGWIDHLANLATQGGMQVDTVTLGIKGRNLVLVGTPEKRVA